MAALDMQLLDFFLTWQPMSKKIGKVSNAGILDISCSKIYFPALHFPSANPMTGCWLLNIRSWRHAHASPEVLEPNGVDWYHRGDHIFYPLDLVVAVMNVALLK